MNAMRVHFCKVLMFTWTKLFLRKTMNIKQIDDKVLRAQWAIDAFASATGIVSESLAVQVGDLICDMMHLEHGSTDNPDLISDLPTNEDRAEWAQLAIDCYAEQAGMQGDPQSEVLKSLKLDLFLLCDANDIDFDHVMESGEILYRQELIDADW